MDNGNGNKRWNWGWVSSAILVIAYFVVVTSYVVTNNNSSTRNTAEIEKQERIHRADMKQIRRDQKEFAEKLYDKLEAINAKLN